MLRLGKFTAVALVFSLSAGGFLSTGALAAEPGDGEPTPGETQFGTFFWIGIAAVVGIATIAIWQGIDDAKEKEVEERARETEDREIEDFDEYFRSMSAEDEGGSEEAATDGDSENEYVKPLAEPARRDIGISRVQR